PAPTSKLTSLTACTRSAAPEKMPRLTRNCFTKFFTRSRGSIIAVRSLQDTRDFVAWRDFAQWRNGLNTVRARERAARRKPAARQRVKRAWHHAGNRLEATPARGCRIDAWNRADQSLRIWMGRPREELFDWCLFHHLAGVHHGNALGGLGDHPHGMGDQHN